MRFRAPQNSWRYRLLLQLINANYFITNLTVNYEMASIFDDCGKT
jgi:hypothetical protein